MLEIHSCHSYAPKITGFMPRSKCFIHKVVFMTMFINEVTKGISIQTYHHEANVDRHSAQSLRIELTQLRTESPTIQKCPILQTSN